MNNSRIDLDNSVKEEATEILNECLVNSLFGVLQSKFAHWNVQGTGFLPAHRFFDEVYKFYSDAADTIAERVVALGGLASGTLYDINSSCELTYEETDHASVATHTTAMANLLSQVSNGYREGIDKLSADKASQDVLIELTREADKLLMFLEAELRPFL